MTGSILIFIFGTIGGGGIDLTIEGSLIFITYPYGKSLSLIPMENHYVVDVLVHLGGSFSLSFGFHPSLTNKETTAIMALFSLVRDFDLI